MTRPRPTHRGPRARGRGPVAGAFTIIEMMIALGVLGILVVVSQSLYSGYQERARAGQATADLRSIATRVEQFRIEFGRLPSALDRAMNPVPADPWGLPYRYLVIEGAPPSVMGQVRMDKNLVPLNSDFDLYSRGPDGESRSPLTAKQSQDDVIRASNGHYFGPASGF